MARDYLAFIRSASLPLSRSIQFYDFIFSADATPAVCVLSQCARARVCVRVRVRDGNSAGLRRTGNAHGANVSRYHTNVYLNVPMSIIAPCHGQTDGLRTDSDKCEWLRSLFDPSKNR